MIICKLTGLQYCQWDEIKDTIGPKNLVKLVREPKYDKPEGLAYKAIYGGFVIGYIPLVDTIRGYWHDSPTKEGKERANAWGKAAIRVRDWLDYRTKYHQEDIWMVPVWEVLYKDSDGYNTKDSGNPGQISLAFDGIDED